MSSPTDLTTAKVTKTEPLTPLTFRGQPFFGTCRPGIWQHSTCRLTYTDPHGTSRDWETAERTTRPEGCDIDGVGIVVVLQPDCRANTSTAGATAAHNSGSGSEKSSNITSLFAGEPVRKPSLLLQKQYRPAIDVVCVELPAGLIDAGETAEECALRELREETGLIGHSAEIGNNIVMFNDPGFCNTNLRLVRVAVDLSRAENQHPTPQLEENEFIDTFAVPLDELYHELQRLEQQGYAIDARVGTVAEGYELARRFEPTRQPTTTA